MRSTFCESEANFKFAISDGAAAGQRNLSQPTEMNSTFFAQSDASPRAAAQRVDDSALPDIQSIELGPLIRAVCSAQYQRGSHDAILGWICAMLDSRPDARVNAELFGVSPSLALLIARMLGWSVQETRQFFLVSKKDVKTHQKAGANLMDGPALAAINMMRLMHCVNTMEVFRKQDLPEGMTPMNWLGQWTFHLKEGKQFTPASYLQLPTGLTMALPWFKNDAARFPDI